MMEQQRGAAGRRAGLLALGLAIACGLALLLARAGSSGDGERAEAAMRAPAAPQVERAPAAGATPLDADEPPRTSAEELRRDVAQPAEPPAEAAAADVVELGSIAGRVLLADGAPLGEWPLRLVRAEELGRAQDVRSFASDAAGRFAIDDVPPGEYRVLGAASRHIGVARGTVSPGEEDVTVVFPRLRVRLLVLAPNGEPVGGASLQLSFEPREGNAFTLASKSRDDGIAEGHLPGEGELTVSAVGPEGELRSGRVSIAVEHGISFETRPVQLVPVPNTASLRVEAFCAGTGERTPYFARLLDPDTGKVLRVLRPETADDDGVFRGLPVGEHDVALGRRYTSPLGMYLGDGSLPVQRVELRPDETTDVAFEMPCGGRLRLTLYEADGRDPAHDVVVQGRLVDADGKEHRLGVITHEEEGRVTVSANVPLGRAVTSETILPAGDYELHLDGSPYLPVRLNVQLLPGRITDVHAPLVRRQ